MRKSGLILLAFSSLVTSPVQAKPIEKTRYKFYPISGETPVQIYSAMIRRGPDVNGVNAYASTSATSTQNGHLVIKGGSCRVDGYAFNIDFTINLPKLKNENALSGPTANKWSDFKSFLKTHEETHRSIWLACARDLENKVRGLRMNDCKALDKKATALWKSMRASCDVKHAQFDSAEQKRLLRHPFVRLVLGRQMASTKAMQAPN